MERGYEVTAEKMNQLKARRYKELAQPVGEPVKYILAFYVLCLLSLVFLPVGIIIGWVWGYSKKQLPDGYKVYAYTTRVREHGRIIFLISMLLFVATVILRILGLR